MSMVNHCTVVGNPEINGNLQSNNDRLMFWTIHNHNVSQLRLKHFGILYQGQVQRETVDSSIGPLFCNVLNGPLSRYVTNIW